MTLCFSSGKPQNDAMAFKILLSLTRTLLPPSPNMSYYTGPIFEIELSSYKLSVAGGGRYDEMIGKYSGGSTPACGFSIGFEPYDRYHEDTKRRSERAMKKRSPISSRAKRPLEKKREVLQKAAALREAGVCVLVSMRNKNFYAQSAKIPTPCEFFRHAPKKSVYANIIRPLLTFVNRETKKSAPEGAPVYSRVSG